jgi:hypothetical protein
MLLKLAAIPYRVVRHVIRAATGTDIEVPPAPRQADEWELRNQALPKGQAHPHSHDHDHDHDHDQVAPATDESAPATKAAAETDAPEEAPAEEAAEPSAKIRPLTQVYPSDTPNPNAWKFTLDRNLLESGSLSFNSADEAKDHALGRSLFSIGGVVSVFAVNDFITVTQDSSRSWSELSPEIIQVIQAHA